MEEIWRDIPGLKNYQASNLGNIRSTGFYQKVYSKNAGYYNRYRKGTVLKPSIRTKGEKYLFVSICIDGVVTSHFVHTLVALAFPDICGDRFQGAEINHLDENPSNNKADNLMWVTHTENNNWGERTEKAMQKIRKPIWQLTIDGFLIDRFPSAYHIERKFGYKNQNISKACNGNNKAYGYKWTKEEDFNPFVLRLLKDVYLQTPLFANPS